MLVKPKIIHRGLPKERKDTHTSFRMQKAVLAKLDEIAASNGITRNNLVAIVLHDYVANRGKPTISHTVKPEKTNGKDESIFS